MNETFCFVSPPGITPVVAPTKHKTELLNLIQQKNLSVTTTNMSLEILSILPCKGPVIVQTAIPPPVKTAAPTIKQFPAMDPLMMANEGLWTYLENIHNDVEEEHLNAPIYFSVKEAGKPTETNNNNKTNNNLLNSIKSFVSSVFRLPSVLKPSPTPSPPMSPKSATLDPFEEGAETDFEDVDDDLYMFKSCLGLDAEDIDNSNVVEDELMQMKEEKRRQELELIPRGLAEPIPIKTEEEKDKKEALIDCLDQCPNRKRCNQRSLVKRSAAVDMKPTKSHRNSPFRPSPNFFHAKKTMAKNRREKQRQDILTDMQEDYGISTESEDTDTEDVPSCTCDYDDDLNLLPVTARNLMEPSCLGQLLTNETDASKPRRRSSSFHASDKDFPPMFASKFKTNVMDSNQLQPNMITKKNAVYFEIPNSPGRVPVKSSRFRTTSVLSTASSSPGSSFETGKFWDIKHHALANQQRPKERVRSVSECSDDLIEFLDDGNMSAIDEDQCWDSDALESTTDEDDDEEEEDENELGGDEENEDETEEELSSSATITDLVYGNLPDSGVEEKKVRFNLKPKVRTMRAWDFAHRQARLGHWEEVGRDRVRFGDRIRRVENELRPILQPNHREQVFKQRFTDAEAPLNNNRLAAAR